MQFSRYLHEGEYLPVTDHSLHLKHLQDQIQMYNLASSKMVNLVLFQEAVHQILKIARILGLERGNMVLIGNALMQASAVRAAPLSRGSPHSS